MADYFEAGKKWDGSLAEKWIIGLAYMKEKHPRVVARFVEAAKARGGINKVLSEIEDMLKEKDIRQRVQVPLTCRYYIKNQYGQSIKFYYDGTVAYARGIISSSVYDLFGVC